MRLIIAMSLLFVLLLFSGFAYAAPGLGPAASNRMCTCCLQQMTTFQPVFTNPHAGWVTMPVETQPICCSSQL